MFTLISMLAVVVVVDSYLIWKDRRNFRYKRAYFLKPDDLAYELDQRPTTYQYQRWGL